MRRRFFIDSDGKEVEQPETYTIHIYTTVVSASTSTTTKSTTLLGNSFDLSKVKYQWINDVLQSSPTKTKAFSDTAIHKVTYQMEDDCTNLDYMFNGSNLYDFDCTEYNMDKITSMRYLFSGCIKLGSIIFENDFTNVKSMESMFEGCTTLTSVTFNENVYSGVTVTNMFANINTNGVLYYPAEYESNFNRIINALPSTWTSSSGDGGDEMLD
jgi:hypothetical protein